jgi:hypothetical protein
MKLSREQNEYRTRLLLRRALVVENGVWTEPLVSAELLKLSRLPSASYLVSRSHYTPKHTSRPLPTSISNSEYAPDTDISLASIVRTACLTTVSHVDSLTGQSCQRQIKVKGADRVRHNRAEWEHNMPSESKLAWLLSILTLWRSACMQ